MFRDQPIINLMVEYESVQLDVVFQALSDGTRRRMLRSLSVQPRSVGELAAPFRISLAAASKHIKVLERAGLVRSWRYGRRVLYAASYDDMRQLLAFLTEDCCSGNPDICGDPIKLAPPLCTEGASAPRPEVA